MSNFFFDGTANVTAQKADTVLISANPALFVSEAQVGADVVITYNNGTTLRVQNTTLNDLPGVQLASGTFSSGASATVTATAANALVFSPSAGATVDVSAGGSSTGIKTVFGGLGVADPNDTADNIVIGGKGSFLIYGNAGSDNITQASGITFDSTSFVTVFGGKDNANGLSGDSITLAQSNTGAKMAIYGGEGTDQISIANSGTGANTIIFGGQGAIDPTDGADSITFNGGGTVQIFGNAGNDLINLGSTTAITAGSSVTVHGGTGGDTINIKAAGGTANANIAVFGDENTTSTGVDTITVGGNAGTTTIYGGRSGVDADDGADVINFSGQGNTNIFAAGGNDAVIVNTTGQNFAADASTSVGLGGTLVTSTNASSINVYLGNGDDSISILNVSASTGTTRVDGGAGNDVFTIGSNVGSIDATASAAAVGTGLSTIVIDNYGIGLDTLRINNNSSVTTGTVSVVSGTFNTLTDALNAAASTTTNSAGVNVVTFGGDTYAVLNRDGESVFLDSVDLAIKLTGTAATTAIASTITIV